MFGATEVMTVEERLQSIPGAFGPAGPFSWESIFFPFPDPQRSSKLDLIRMGQADVSKKIKTNLTKVHGSASSFKLFCVPPTVMKDLRGLCRFLQKCSGFGRIPDI